MCSAHFANSHHPCFSQYVCMCMLFCVNLCCRVAIILKKNHICGLEHFQSNGASLVLLVIDLDFHFQGQHFWHYIILANTSQMVRDSANITISIK